MDNTLPAAKLIQLGMVDYLEAYHLQQELVEKRRSGGLADDHFIVTEHPPTFTLGRRGGRENLMVSEQFLTEKNIPLVPIERGGDITFHGPGQLVVYPILHLRQCGLSVTDYVGLLEETMLQLARKAGVEAVRDPRNHGVWVKGKKLGSVGIAIRHGVCFHGLALNGNLLLEPFSWVNPCGLTGVSMTTLSSESGQEISTLWLLEAVKPVLEDVFERPLEVEKREWRMESSQGIL